MPRQVPLELWAGNTWFAEQEHAKGKTTKSFQPRIAFSGVGWLAASWRPHLQRVNQAVQRKVLRTI